MFTDDSALEFYLDGGKTKISYIPAGELVFPEKENNINEHMLFAPVFGRTVSEYSIRSHQPNGRWQLLIDVFFKGGLFLNISDVDMFIVEEKNRPMQVSKEEIREMIPHYEDYIDDELDLRKKKSMVVDIIEGKRKEDNSIEARLIRKLLEIRNDPEMVDHIMECLKTDKERQKLFDIAEAGGEEAEFYNLVHIAIEMEDERENKNLKNFFASPVALYLYRYCLRAADAVKCLRIKHSGI